MSRFTMLLALLWLPATMHCQLEVLSGLEILSCCNHQDAEHTLDHHDQDCAKDGCLALEFGFYKPQDTGLTLKPSSSFFCAFLGEQVAPDQPGLLALAAGAPYPPPDTLRIWQFVQRTALPPRAPGFAG